MIGEVNEIYAADMRMVLDCLARIQEGHKPSKKTLKEWCSRQTKDKPIDAVILREIGRLHSLTRGTYA